MELCIGKNLSCVLFFLSCCFGCCCSFCYCWGGERCKQDANSPVVPVVLFFSHIVLFVLVKNHNKKSQNASELSNANIINKRGELLIDPRNLDHGIGPLHVFVHQGKKRPPGVSEDLFRIMSNDEVKRSQVVWIAEELNVAWVRFL